MADASNDTEDRRSGRKTSHLTGSDDEPDNSKDTEPLPSEPASADGDAAAVGDDKSKRKRKRKRKNKSTEANEEDSQGSEDKRSAKLASLDLTVFVEGIPFDCSEQDVRDFFVSNGCEDVLELRLPRWQDSGRLRGYGHVVFDSEASRQRAVQDLHGKHLGKRYLSIQAPKTPRENTTQGAANQRTVRPQPEGCKVVFVRNLPYDATEEDIWAAFHVCGKIVEGGVRIARNYQTQQSKGFAYVEFKNPEGALGAVQKAAKPFGMTVSGRPCFVDYEEGTMKGSYKTKEGRQWTREYGKSGKTTNPS